MKSYTSYKYRANESKVEKIEQQKTPNTMLCNVYGPNGGV